VVDCIERRRQVQADQDSDLFVVGSRVDSIKNFQQRSFSGVSFPLGRPVLAEVRSSEQMGTQACQHESLQYLGDGREVGDGPVVTR